MSGDTLPFPGGDFPRPFGVPTTPVCERICPHCGAGVGEKCRGASTTRQHVAMPESAAEHLRNALQLLATGQGIAPADDDDEPCAVLLLRDLEAVRRRVAAALAQLEGK